MTISAAAVVVFSVFDFRPEKNFAQPTPIFVLDTVAARRKNAGVDWRLFCGNGDVSNETTKSYPLFE